MALALQATGLLVVLVSAVYWGATGRESIPVIVAALCLVALGTFIHISREALKDDRA